MNCCSVAARVGRSPCSASLNKDCVCGCRTFLLRCPQGRFPAVELLNQVQWTFLRLLTLCPPLPPEGRRHDSLWRHSVHPPCLIALSTADAHCAPGRHRDWDPLSTSLAPRVLLLYSSHFKSWQIWQAKYSVWSHVAFAELLVRYNVFPYVCNSFWITFSPHFPIGVTGHIGSDRKTPFPDKGIILSREKQKAKPTPVNTKAEGQDFSCYWRKGLLTSKQWCKCNFWPTVHLKDNQKGDFVRGYGNPQCAPSGLATLPTDLAVLLIWPF